MANFAQEKASQGDVGDGLGDVDAGLVSTGNAPAEAIPELGLPTFVLDLA
jgi:hypothetical protein